MIFQQVQAQYTYTVKQTNLAGINFLWLALPKVFTYLIFTIQWQFSSISLPKVKAVEVIYHGFASWAEISWTLFYIIKWTD